MIFDLSIKFLSNLIIQIRRLHELDTVIGNWNTNYSGLALERIKVTISWSKLKWIINFTFYLLATFRFVLRSTLDCSARYTLFLLVWNATAYCVNQSTSKIWQNPNPFLTRMLAFNTDDMSSNPAKAYRCFCKMLFEKAQKNKVEVRTGALWPSNLLVITTVES